MFNFHLNFLKQRLLTKKRLLLIVGIPLLIIILGVSFSKLGPIVWQAWKQSAEETIRQADDALNEKYYQEALSLYQKALQLDKSNSYSYLKIAEIYSLKGQYNHAVEILNQGVQNADSKENLYLAEARAYFELGDFEKTISLLASADTQKTETHLLFGKAYLKQNNLSEAQKEFRTVDFMRNRDPEAHYYLSLILAIDHLEDALSEVKLAAEQSWEKITEAQELQKALQEALEAKNDLYQRTLVCHQILIAGFPKVVLDPLAAVLKQDPQYRDALLVLGTAYLDLNQSGEALSRLNAAYEVDPNFGNTSFLLAKYYSLQEDYSQAEKHFRRAIKLEPLNRTFRAGFSSFYESQQKFEESAEILEELIKLEDDEKTKMEYQIHLAFIYLDQLENYQKGGELANGLKLLIESQTVAASLLELKAQILDLYYWSLYKNGQKQASLEGFEDLIQKYPYEALFWYHQGKVQKTLGKTDESEKSLERAQDLDLTGEVIKLIDET